MLILLFVFSVSIVFEKGYMKNTQEGALKIYQAREESSEQWIK